MISALRAAASASVLAIVLALAACAGPPPGLAGPAGRDMQQTVTAIAEHAAAGDAAAALAELDALQQRLDDARAADDITADRAALVQRSIDLVRADLEVVAAENAPPAPAVTEDPGVGTVDTSDGESTENSGGGKDKENNGKKDNEKKGKKDDGKGKGNGD